MNSTAIRKKLYDYFRVVDDKKLHAIYNLLKEEIEQTDEWWKDKIFTAEIDDRYESLENGSDNGFTVEQVKQSVSKLRVKRYGK